MNRTLFSLYPWPVPEPCVGPCACTGACKPGYVSPEERERIEFVRTMKAWESIPLRLWVAEGVVTRLRRAYQGEMPKLEGLIRDAILNTDQ